VLLVHGLGASAHYWGAVIAATSGHELVAPDLLGFGRSPAPPDVRYDLACHLAALGPLVEPATTVVGHSTGGIVAAALAAVHADRVRGLLLVGLPAFPDAATARAEIGRIGLLARLTVEQRPAGRLLCEAMCHVRPLAVAAAPLIVRDMPRAVAADAARHTWASYSRTLHNVVVDHRVEDDLRRVSAPTVLLHGRDDRSAPLRYVERLAARLDRDNVTLEVADGDHHLPVRHPEVVVRAIESLTG
jgi:pimeloyl-ACP methyl ester carboxylesterase